MPMITSPMDRLAIEIRSRHGVDMSLVRARVVIPARGRRYHSKKEFDFLLTELAYYRIDSIENT